MDDVIYGIFMVQSAFVLEVWVSIDKVLWTLMLWTKC